MPKHPLFFLEGLIQSLSPQLQKYIFGDESHLVSYKDDTELIDEDEDAKLERQTIYNLDKKLYG